MIETILADENEKRKIKLYLGVNNFSDVFSKIILTSYQKA